MRITERTIVQHWRGTAVLCAIVALFGIAWATWNRVDESDQMYRAALAEADKRGDAISTLAGDVRALREQIKASGETPVAPDPEQAVDDLPDRTEVPVPIPGPAGIPGLPGQDGDPGAPGQDGADGPQGAPGEPGSQGPSGPAGPQGVPGTDGVDGADGADGADGQNCPTGYSLQVPDWDPDSLVCRRGTAPAPAGDPAPSAMAALPPGRRRVLATG